MDGLSSAASVIAVIQLTGSLVKLCGGYIQEVRNARDQIFTLQRAIAGLQGTLQDLQKLLQSNDGKALPTSSRLVSNLTDCYSDLRALEATLDPGDGKKLMKKMGLRALKWPLKRAEVEGVIQNLGEYKSLFLLSLQVDQTSLMVGVVQNTDRISQNIDLTKLEGSIEAGFDSFSDRDEVQCLQGTRTELLQQIIEWAMSPSQEGIFWLKGMAGTGKSTISRTVARSFKDTNHLGASFFFKRGEGDRGNAKRFFPTLIRQLMLRLSELRSGVQKALDYDPDIASKSLKEQFEKLLLYPLLNLDQLGRQPQTAVIVIDALDECEHDQDVRNIIRLLPLLQKAKAVRLRIFLTSRPELPILLGFSEMADHEYQDLALHEIPEEVTEHDIHLFLRDRFAKIRLERDVPQNWPSNNVIHDLIAMSVPLFISAATVCRFLEDPMWEPAVRLAELLNDQAKYSTKMEKTYLPILTQLLRNQDDDESELLIQQFQEIVGVIILLAVPLSVNALSQLLQIKASTIKNMLESFQSVLNIPDDQDIPIRILHSSFRDFLLRSKGKFRVHEQQTHMKISNYCLTTMCNGLKRNICALSSYGTQRTQIDTQIIDQNLPTDLQYSCRYWAHHLTQCNDRIAETKNVLPFLQKHFLHWIEAMSILDLASEVVGILNLLELVLGGGNNALSEFLSEAKLFFLRVRNISDDVPLQIYFAGLIFAPNLNVIRQQNEAEIPDWIRVFPEVQERWTSELQTLNGHSDFILSIAFSTGGWPLAFGSPDLIDQLWNTSTDSLQRTLGRHSNSILLVAFSPDGRMLASGSSDTIEVWDATTGVLQQTLQGPFGPVLSIAFSPDSRLLASGSYDKTIQLWDITTGVVKQNLRGHSDLILFVAFSPDKRLLASGSSDKTIRLWDTVTGALQQTLQGHLGPVLSIEFSPDSRLLASGSYDKTVRLWTVATGFLQKTLKDHSNPVHLLAFSPDSRLLASVSSDNNICLWYTATGALQHSLEGHLGPILSIVFSPDSQLLASGSSDKIVRLWDIANGTLQKSLVGHSNPVLSVQFSPDSRLLASGSSDKTVRLWDTDKGTLQTVMKGHSKSVLSVAFSPDGGLLASGSDDKTVRLRNPTTGALHRNFANHLEKILSVTFSPDGHLLASSSGEIRLWNTTTGAPQQILEIPPCTYFDSVAFSPDGRLLVSASSSLSSHNTIRLWDITTGALQQTLNNSPGFSPSVVFSPDGTLLVSYSSDGIVRLWDVATGTLQQVLELTGHSKAVLSVAISPDGRLLVSGSADKTVRLWNVTTGALEKTFKGHSNAVQSVIFSPDGRLLASSSDDKTVLWNITTGDVHQIWAIEEVALNLEFSKDNSYLRTNLGFLRIQSKCDIQARNPTYTNLEIFIEQGQWVKLNGEKVLWLPPESRPTCSAIHDNTLALGHTSGRVSFIRFGL